MLEFILIRGGDKTAPMIAKHSGWGYGIRHDYKPYATINMLDIKWGNYDWDNYIQIVRSLKPRIAMVADYEHPRQKDLMLQQISDLFLHVDTICACPKFPGAANDIPNYVRLAISIPAKTYSGFIPPLSDITNRDLHLLGGNPHRQLEFALLAKSVNATVKSLDANYHVRKSGFGQYFDNGRWIQITDRHINSIELAIISGRNIKKWFVRNYSELETPLLI